MRLSYFIAGPLGLGLPELIVIIVILIVVFSRQFGPERGTPRGRDSKLSREEFWVMLCLGALLAVFVATRVWPRLAH